MHSRDLLKKLTNQVLDNTRYQKCALVAEKAKALGISLLYLPTYSPNFNLIERLWRFVKKALLYSAHYDNFEAFKNSIDTVLMSLELALNPRYNR